MSRPPRVVAAAPRMQARAKRQRRDRRMRVLRRTAWVFVGCAPLVVAGWVLLGSQLLAVQKLTITGAHRVSVQQVDALVDVPMGTPLARIDTGAIAKRLRALAPVASVSVTRDWPHGLRVSIVERVVVAAQRVGASYALLDDTATTVATSPTIPTGVLALVSTSPPATLAALDVLQSLPAGLRTTLGSLQAVSAEQVTLLLKDGRQVIWGGDTDNAVKVLAVTALLKMPGTVFDVSAKGVATRR